MLDSYQTSSRGQEMLDNVAEDPTYIKRIITNDEKWVYEYVENVKLSSR